MVREGQCVMDNTQIWAGLPIGAAGGLVLLAAAAYLYGSIPFAYLATYLLKRKSLTQAGTGNVGVTNAWHVGGLGAVLITLLGEASKAFVVLGLAGYFYPGQIYVKLLLVVVAFVGTNFSVFLHWRGGRGTTMLIWSIGLLSPLSLLVLIGIAALCFFLARRYPRCRPLWSWFIPVVILLVEQHLGFALFGLLVSLLIFLKSRVSQPDTVYYGYVPEE